MPAPRPRIAAPLLAGALALLAPAPPADASLADELGRNAVRVYSAPVVLEPGPTVTGAGLPERLEARGYRRVHARPEVPGEYFWGHERFWIHRRSFRAAGREHGDALLRLDLERDGGRILEVTVVEGDGPAALEPVLVAESLDADRGRRYPVRLDGLPEHAWRAVLAAEDHRFFDHSGLDARALARAALKNALAGEVVQGGSTITQQLVKVRDLTPRRTLGRKASEAVRALALEAEHDKREILTAYLDAVYFGHLDGVSIYGLGAAARAYYGRPPEELGVAEAATLAAMIQGPNRLSPVRHPEAVLERQRWVLSRLEELGWITAREARRARARGLGALAPRPPAPSPAGWYLSLVRGEVERAAPRRLERGRGVVVETALDPRLQEAAEEAVAGGLARLERAHPRLARAPLQAALVALDADSGAVVASVGGRSGRGDDFDRVTRARRQPGSTVKPLVLLEAFAECGGRDPLHPATRVLDRPLTLELPSGPWSPANPGDAWAGVVDLREATVRSLNVPFVRAARWCGLRPTARRLRRAGLDIPADPPPSFVLGSVETTPLGLASAYTALADGGRRHRPRAVTRLERPSGRWLPRRPPASVRVSGDAAAHMVRELLAAAMAEGTAAPGAVDTPGAFGKTGTSSERRDAWFAGGAAGLVTVAWVGLDDGAPLGLSGGAAAAPIWRAFMERAAAARPAEALERPRRVVERWLEEATGRVVDHGGPGRRRELFRRWHQPPSRRLLRPDPPLPAIE